MNTDLLIIGGGAAGLMCAWAAARRGLSVQLAEKNEKTGRKLLVTGKGRCNVTNNCDNEEFLKNLCVNHRFMYSAINAFSTADTMRFFEEHGVPLKTERGGRVFPVSDRAEDIARALEAAASEAGASIIHGTCSGLVINEGLVGGAIINGEEMKAEAVVVATGGVSYPATGSTGDGYRMARQAGHSVVQLRPSLVSIRIKEGLCRDAMGLSLRNATLRLLDANSGKPLYTELGELLFTHFGISGPLALSASAHMRKDAGGYRIDLDLKPGLTEKQLDARILRDFTLYANRDFINALGDLLPRKLIPVIALESGIPFDAKVNQITRVQRTALRDALKRLRLTPVGLRPIEEAVVTSGGVSVKEINPKTMESKLVKGLYFAGEVVDVDGYTGGFNLQAAFSTGFLAGNNVIRG